MRNCVAAEKDTFTVSGRNSYTNPDGSLPDYDDDGLEDEDLNGDGQVDSIIGIENYAANVQFFAWADDNRMPVRRVMVD